MNWIFEWVNNNTAAALMILYIIGSNLIVNLPKVEELQGRSAGVIAYEYFYKVVTGILQMVPNPKPKAPVVGPVDTKANG